MENIKIKYNVLLKALGRFDEAIKFFEAIKKMDQSSIKGFDYNTLYQASRDSLVQRFEFSIELFWKYLKLYLEGVKNVQLESNTPRDVFRAGCRARLISEQDTEKFIDILRARNLTSHIYMEEIAEQLARDLPGFYKYIKTIADKLNP